MPQFRPRQTKRAQELRNNATEAEQCLWVHLRLRQLRGFKFSRQMSVGPFVCDFLCRERGLVVELDGGQHGDRVAEDKHRTAFLNAHGLTVLRFWNNDIFENVNGVLEAIIAELEQLPAKFERPPRRLARGEEPRSGEGAGPISGISQGLPTPQPAPASGRGLK